MHGDCVAFTATHAKIVVLKAMAKEHDLTTQDGPCAEATVRCEDTHGYKICASKEGVDGSDIIDLDDIHAMHHGRCYDAHGTTDQIEALREEATSHGVTVEDGKCADATDCHKWKGMKVCRSGKAGNWGDSDTIHFIKHKGMCLQLQGAAVANVTFDENMTKYIAKRYGAKLEEGNCKAAGFTVEVHHHIENGMTASVWK